MRSESKHAILNGQMSVKNRPIDHHPLDISLVQKIGLLELLVLRAPIALGVDEIANKHAVTSSKLADTQIGAELSAASEDALIHGGVLSSTWSKFEAFGFLSTEIARIIDTSIKSIQRKKKSDYLLSVSEADRTVRIGKVLVEALDAFEGDGDKVLGWLRSPVRHLGGKTPMDMLATEAGTALVRESLGAIAYGGVG